MLITTRTKSLVVAILTMALAVPAFAQDKASLFVGATWDIGAARPNKNSGFFIGLRVHFADFGPVYDAQYVAPLLGPDAGNLDGPLYLIRIGYSGR